MKNKYVLSQEEWEEVLKYDVVDPIEISSENKIGGFDLLVQDYIHVGYDLEEAEIMARNQINKENEL